MLTFLDLSCLYQKGLIISAYCVDSIHKMPSHSSWLIVRAQTIVTLCLTPKYSCSLLALAPAPFFSLPPSVPSAAALA